MQAIPAMLEKREVFSCAPTGSGKTIAYLLPLIHLLLSTRCKKNKKIKGICTLRSLIIIPTLELAKQVYQEVCKLTVNLSGINIKSLEGCDNANWVKDSNVDSLIATPHRLIEILTKKTIIDLSKIELLILDESDRLLEDGLNNSRVGFRQQVAEILKYCMKNGDVENNELRRAMFSATSTEIVFKWVLTEFKDVVRIVVGTKNTTVSSVTQTLKYCGNEDGKVLAIRELIYDILDKQTLIFVQSQKRARELWKCLMLERKIPIGIMHGHMTQKSRNLALELFREKKLSTLICTDLMARGIDVEDIQLVINYDFPQSSLSYIHRIGRTGRAGRNGEAITFFTDSDKSMLRTIANVMKESGCSVPDFILKLKKPGRKEKRKIWRSAPKRRKIQEPKANLLKTKKKHNLEEKMK